jgi:hypothetical protein
MNPCCIEYLAELDRCEADWRQQLADGMGLLTKEQLDELLAEHEQLRQQIKAGTYSQGSCPWDPAYFNGPFAESYKWFTRYWAAGGKTEDLEFGPIQVMPHG